MRRCTVSIIGKDGDTHSFETDANSLFDAAYKAIESWGMLGWFPLNADIEVRSGNQCWRVKQGRVRVWATGSTRRRRRSG
jgi:hypothetical protein